jgi:hypothetical protein
MSKGMGRWAIARHLSAADERFALLLLLVRASWAPLRRLDPGAAEAFNRIDAAQPGRPLGVCASSSSSRCCSLAARLTP